MGKDEINKRNKCLIDFLKQHKGYKSVVSGYEVIEHLQRKGYSLKYERLRPLIYELRKAYNLPVGFKKMEGYFWCVTADDVQIVETILSSEIKEKQEHIQQLKNAVAKNKSGEPTHYARYYLQEDI